MKQTLFLTLMLLTSFSSFCATYQSETFERQWAICQYQTSLNTAQIKCYEHLIRQIKQLQTQHQDDLTLKTLHAINLASLAGVDDAPSPLKLIREAKDTLQEVINKDPSTLHSAAYVILGALYYRAPGWPISFGDNDKAEKYLKKAIAIHPENLTTLYFYADFLATQGKKKEAITYLNNALKLDISSNRTIANAGRKADIQRLLDKLQK